jgi:hypothetical protein
MEKTQQIGELVQRQQEQKRTLAHLNLKGDSIAAAYSAFGVSRDRWGGGSGDGQRVDPAAKPARARGGCASRSHDALHDFIL